MREMMDDSGSHAVGFAPNAQPELLERERYAFNMPRGSVGTQFSQNLMIRKSGSSFSDIYPTASHITISAHDDNDNDLDSTRVFSGLHST